MLQVVAQIELAKRDVSDESDVSDVDTDSAIKSDTTTSVGSTTSVDTTTSFDECALLAAYVETGLAAGPIPPVGPAAFVSQTSSSVFVAVLNETVPTFFDLLQSAPSLFADLSLAIDDAFAVAATAVDSSELAALADDFVTVANVSCDISLSQQQVDDVTALFASGLTVFREYVLGCDLLLQNAVANVIGLAASTGGDPNQLPFLLRLSAGANIFQIVHLEASIATLGAATDVPSAVQAAVDDFLFGFGEFCGFPPFGQTTLDELEHFLDVAA